jgi:hypothetical protein
MMQPTIPDPCRARANVEIQRIMDRIRKSSISVYWMLLAVNIPGIALFSTSLLGYGRRAVKKACTTTPEILSLGGLLHFPFLRFRRWLT